MKTHIKLMYGTGAILIATCAACADNSITANSSDNTDARPMRQQTVRTALRATDFVGLKVENYQGQKLGKVEDLAVNLEARRVVQVFVARGGFAGLDTTLVAVPLSSLNYDLANNVLRLDATPERMQGAPTVDISRWDEANTSNQVASACAYFKDSAMETSVSGNSSDERTMFKWHKDKAAKEEAAENAALYAPGAIRRESKLLDSIVENTDARTIGRVENLILDLPSSKILAVVVSPSEVMGSDTELMSYAPSALRFRDDNDHLVLNTTAVSLTSNNTSANSDTENSSRVTAMDQGNNQSDINITAQIRKDVLADKSMSVAAQNIQIITIKGHVILAGAVDSSAEKQNIYAIASRVVAPGDVSNQLIIAPNAHTVMNN